MAAKSNSVDTLTRDHEVAALFRLPHELRDQIYDYCHQKQRYKDSQTPPGRPVRSLEICAPLPQLREVSRRVKAEYDKRSFTSNYLKLTLEMFIPYCKPYDRLPRLATMSTRLDLNLDFVEAFMQCWDSPGGFTVQQIISSALPTLHEDLPHVKDLRVRLRFDRSWCNWIPRIVRSMERFDRTFKDHQVRFTSLESFTDISIVWEELDGSRNVNLTRWTSKDGLALHSAALATHRKQCSTYHWCRQENRNIDHMPFTAFNRSREKLIRFR